MAVDQPAAGVYLLDEDPELAAGLADDELKQARRLLYVPVQRLPPGDIDVSAAAGGPSLGLLVLDGLVTVNVSLCDRIASHLAGAGDVLHLAVPPASFVPADVTFVANEPIRVAVLDRRIIAALRRWPAMLLTLHERQRVRERALAVHAAIGKLRRVHERILALLWHLAERWGRVGADGVILPLALTHAAIGHLAGAERPTVSLALKELAEAGDVVRRADGAFLLRPGSERQLEVREPLARPGQPLRVVRTADAPSLQMPPPHRAPLVDLTVLRERITVLRDGLPELTREVEGTLTRSRSIAKATAGTRERMKADRAKRSQ